VLPDPLDDHGSLELDGHEIQVIEVGQGDIEHSSIVYAHRSAPSRPAMWSTTKST
jgi:hypothetical protein